MKKMILRVAFILTLAFLASANLFAQAPPFWNEIAAFKHQDSLHQGPEKPILFVGSSSFRKWTDLQNDFPGYPVLNRGFGGSTFPDLMRYAGDIIIPYDPKQILIYCGDNDLASSDTVTAAVVFRRFRQLFSFIRGNLKNAGILFVSIKPSPSRERLLPRIEEANRLIHGFLLKQKHAAFIDVYHAMLTPAGHPIDDIFVEDKLHMNAKGYAIWTKIIRPYLHRS